ncbi:MAG: hypothetical protein JWM91_4158 [Rhodospirillales bacterium]|nr:hypothetical protein [Rhodospirillales bacterium]
MIRSVSLALAAASILGGCATQNQGAPSNSASIPFVEFGNINDWRAEGTSGIYIQSDDRHWYHATFTAPCIDLPYAERIGFRTTPPLPMDKFDAILVRGQPCYFKTFKEVPGPPSNNPPKPAAPPTM